MEPILTPRTCDAFLSAVENARDAGMAEAVTLADLTAWADGYVADGLSACTCRRHVAQATALDLDEFDTDEDAEALADAAARREVVALVTAGTPSTLADLDEFLDF